MDGEGKYYIEYYSADKAGNIEETHNQTHWLEKSPPTTLLEIGKKYVNNTIYVSSATPFCLTAKDNPENNSGVAFSWYTIDGDFYIGDSFTLQSLNGPPADSRAYNTVDMVFRQLVHGMAGAVAVVSVSVPDDVHRVFAAVIQGEVRRRAEMFTDGVFEPGIAVGRNTH